jgi:hypothetical protein
VKSRPSRRLLQTINAFEEDIISVIDVLLQQKRVFSALQDYLNPWLVQEAYYCSQDEV